MIQYDSSTRIYKLCDIQSIVFEFVKLEIYKCGILNEYFFFDYGISLFFCFEMIQYTVIRKFNRSVVNQKNIHLLLGKFISHVYSKYKKSVKIGYRN